MNGGWVLPDDTGPPARLMLRRAAALARCGAVGLVLAIIALDASLMDALVRQAAEVIGEDLQVFPYLLAAADPAGSLQRLVQGLTIVALIVPVGISVLLSPNDRNRRSAFRRAFAPAGGFRADPKRLLAEICPIDAISPRGSPLLVR